MCDESGEQGIVDHPTESLTIKFRIVGPIKRSTLDQDDPDPEWERLTDAGYWCSNTRLQIQRLEESLRREFSGGRSSHVSFDEHGVCVAGANLDRAIQRLRKGDLNGHRPEDRFLRALRLLRNLYEHWDELRSAYRRGLKRGAAAKLTAEFPEAEPWSLTLEPGGDVVLANVVSLREFIRGVRAFECRVLRELRALRKQGRHVALRHQQQNPKSKPDSKPPE